MSNPTPRLGRGLGALIGTPSPAPAPLPTTSPAPGAQRIPLDRIAPNRFQPRADFDEAALSELAESIRSTGLLQPVIVRPAADGTYELIAGERRFRASKLAGMADIPAVVRTASDHEALELALIENLQREDLGPLERAAAYQRYLETFGGTPESLAALLSESRSNVVNYLRLLKLQPEVAFMLGRGDLSMGHARALLGVEDAQQQLGLARLVARRNLSVRQVEELAKRASGATQPAAAVDRATPDRHIADVEAALSKALGVRVRLRSGRRKNSGRIVIQYGSLDEFERIVERLGGIESVD